MAARLDLAELLKELEKIQPPESDKSAEVRLRNVSMTVALPALTEIDHEKEFQVCQLVAKHLLGQLPVLPTDLD